MFTSLEVLAPTDDGLPAAAVSFRIIGVGHVAVRRHLDEAKVPEAGAAPQRLHPRDSHRTAAGHGGSGNGHFFVTSV